MGDTVQVRHSFISFISFDLEIENLERFPTFYVLILTACAMLFLFFLCCFLWNHTKRIVWFDSRTLFTDATIEKGSSSMQRISIAHSTQCDFHGWLSSFSMRRGALPHFFLVFFFVHAMCTLLTHRPRQGRRPRLKLAPKTGTTAGAAAEGNMRMASSAPHTPR